MPPSNRPSGEDGNALAPISTDEMLNLYASPPELSPYLRELLGGEGMAALQTALGDQAFFDLDLLSEEARLADINLMEYGLDIEDGSAAMGRLSAVCTAIAEHVRAGEAYLRAKEKAWSPNQRFRGAPFFKIIGHAAELQMAFAPHARLTLRRALAGFAARGVQERLVARIAGDVNAGALPRKRMDSFYEALHEWFPENEADRFCTIADAVACAIGLFSREEEALTEIEIASEDITPARREIRNDLALGKEYAILGGPPRGRIVRIGDLPVWVEPRGMCEVDTFGGHEPDFHLLFGNQAERLEQGIDIKELYKDKRPPVSLSFDRTTGEMLVSGLDAPIDFLFRPGVAVGLQRLISAELLRLWVEAPLPEPALEEIPAAPEAPVRGEIAVIVPEIVRAPTRRLRQYGCAEVLRACIRLFGEPVRITGSHHIFEAADGTRCPIPLHMGKDVDLGVLRYFLRRMKISRADFEAAVG